MGKEMMDRRVTQRIPFETEVTIQFSDGKPSIKATATNISVGGMQFTLPKGAVKLPPEEVITLSFKLPDQFRVSIRGEVCRFSNGLDHNRKQVVSYAVKFQEVSQYIWNYIFDFCQMRYGGDEVDPALRPAVAPEPLQQLNQGSNPTPKPNSPSLPPTDPTLMEWTLRDSNAGKPTGDGTAMDSFITPSDEPLMNWVFNQPSEEKPVTDSPKTKDDLHPKSDTVSVIENTPQLQDGAPAETPPVSKRNQPEEEKKFAQNQELAMNALENSMTELLKQMDPYSATKKEVGASFENSVSLPSDLDISEQAMDTPTVPEPVVENAAENTSNLEQNEVEQPPLKRSLFSWSRKSSPPFENYEKNQLSDDDALSFASTTPGNAVEQDTQPFLEFDAAFSQNVTPANPTAPPFAANVKEPGAPVSLENQPHQSEIHPIPPEPKPIPEPSFFGKGTGSAPTPPPPKEPEKQAVPEEIDISFMNRNSSMISLDQQMIDRIIHAMRTNSKKDPNSNTK